ncbi:MAG: TlpA disulfide reductase family protein [Acidobacteriota bacterium]
MLRKGIVVAGLTLVISAAWILVSESTAGLRSRFSAAAPFQAPDLSGKMVGPQSYTGSVVLVNFWATFCRPCVDEMPSLDRVYQEYRSRGLVVLAVSIDEGVPEIEQFQKRFQLSFPIAHDRGKAISTAWGTEKVPETYVIARNGELRTKVVGAIDWSGPGPRAMVEALLAER